MLSVLDRAAREGIVVGVDTIVAKAGGRIVFVVCNSFGGFCCCVEFVAGLIVVDDISRGPSDLFTKEAFVTVTKVGVAEAAIDDDATLPSLFIENTM